MEQITDLLRTAMWLALLGGVVLLGGRILDQLQNRVSKIVR